MEAVVELKSESKFMGSPTSLCVVVKARKLSVALRPITQAHPTGGQGAEGRQEPRSEGLGGADKWGASGGISRWWRERTPPRQARLAREQESEGGAREPSLAKPAGCLPAAARWRECPVTPA